MPIALADCASRRGIGSQLFAVVLPVPGWLADCALGAAVSSAAGRSVL
jgi:hypothetical protein